MTTTKKEEDSQNSQNKQIIELNKRLGVVIALILHMIPQDGTKISLKRQVQILASLGIRPRDIAEILGRTQPHINKELAGLRNNKGK